MTGSAGIAERIVEVAQSRGPTIGAGVSTTGAGGPSGEVVQMATQEALRVLLAAIEV